ncbi:DUF2254 domain-containing protein [Chroococcidiopsis sp. FACHB-1243]|uniref:DUF2254 family protein n=1 Tax=Chroococcidiopsis sp. [FACHB-1243] TaxID=2692781 RepID=UPI001783096E|nr:DUF2254 family protein [Chroococcidiopsis sp. [FACHB-1243]]MBD2307727.1 DUF2254 domain-containing protein [Chroococcidiopsis sp. [FACHB-1243]]
MTIPTCTIIGFLLLAAGSYTLDRTQIAWLEPLRHVLKLHVFSDTNATSNLLGTISSGIITITSITISLLLVALQQSASSLTYQVSDQFLRRPLNQFYFGFFVGLALYALATLATVNEPFNPVFGATLALLLIVIALYLLLLLLYTTINQMRPVVIIEAIHDRILAAREHQLHLIQKTRRASRYKGAVRMLVTATRHGSVTHIDIDSIGAVVKDVQGEVEIVLLVSIGSYVAFQDAIALFQAQTDKDAARVKHCVQDAIRLEVQRDIDTDPEYGIEQLATIAWTSISTSKSNPYPGLLTIHSLRNILAQWSIEQDEDSDEQPIPVVYTDNVLARLMDAFESLAVVSSESMQHQNFIEVVHTFAIMFDRLPPEQQQRAESLILCILSALGDHVLTTELDAALSALVCTLRSSARFDTADAVQVAQDKLRLSIGKLNSRSTRSLG